ncbi:MAG: Gfo/Idh/MocA family oxidoreductase [Clostridia bacterium]
MKVGLIGCGGMGMVHNRSLKALCATHGVEVTAIADCREEFLNKGAALWPQAARYATGMELLQNAEIELVHICLPSYLHTTHAVFAMEKGMHVMLEKPACLTREDCQLLLDTQRRTGAKVMVGQVLRSFSEYAYLKAAYEDGRFGKLRSVMMQRVSGDVRWGFEDWFHDAQRSGSVALDLHIHDLDFLRYLLGEPDAVKVMEATAFCSGMVNHIITSYRFGEVQAVAEGVWDLSPALPFEASFRACFEEATLVFNSRAKPSIKVYHRDGSITEPPQVEEVVADEQSEGLNIEARGPYYEEIKYFIECLQQNHPNTRAPLSEGVASVQLALEEYEMAQKLCR